METWFCQIWSHLVIIHTAVYAFILAVYFDAIWLCGVFELMPCVVLAVYIEQARMKLIGLNY